MAKIKFTAFVSDMRGKVAGSVFSKNRSGAFVRTKVTPSNPQSSFQGTARSRFGSLSQQWRGLTQAERDSFNSAVDDFTRTNVFGDTVRPSGENLFIRLNMNRLFVGETVIKSAPSPVELPVIGIDTLKVEETNFEVNILNESDPAFAVLVYATRQVSPGRSNISNLFTFMKQEPLSSADLTSDFATEYVAKYGNGVVGQRIGVGVRAVNIATGQAGVRTTQSGIVVADTP